MAVSRRIRSLERIVSIVPGGSRIGSSFGTEWVTTEVVAAKGCARVQEFLRESEERIEEGKNSAAGLSAMVARTATPMMRDELAVV
jgi:hypothetical protein